MLNRLCLRGRAAKVISETHPMARVLKFASAGPDASFNPLRSN